ncbi:MAG: hypothetical protein HYX87_06275 [Chloroflexi bacterium]|nr:hypothetical protein [Chloroflexota bacterium]
MSIGTTVERFDSAAPPGYLVSTKDGLKLPHSHPMESREHGLAFKGGLLVVYPV